MIDTQGPHSPMSVTFDSAWLFLGKTMLSCTTHDKGKQPWADALWSE
jgi:hypothetical protein